MASTVGLDQAGSPASVAKLAALTRAPGITGHSGPYPVTFTSLAVNGQPQSASIMVEGRDEAPAAVDQPQITTGDWVRPGEAVVERNFADALGIRPGDRITLDDRSFRVAWLAVTAAVPLYPNICYFFGCGAQLKPFGMANPGLVWLTQPDARSLATRAEPLAYLLNLKLAAGAETGAFANACFDDAAAPMLYNWQCIGDEDDGQVQTEQEVLLTASWLLGLLAVGSVAVLVGGRMMEQTRRAGVLKAAGGTPGLVAVVLLAEHLSLGVAAGLGLLAGQLAAPLVTGPGAGLLGAAITPPVTVLIAGLAVVVALAIAGAATLIPALRAARASTAAMLADAAKAPSRSPLLVGISAKLPIPLLLGLRLAGRRPRRTLLSVASVAVAVTGVVAALYARASLDRFDSGSSGANGPLDQVLLVVTVALVVLAAVNAILIASATVTDARLSSAVARALGATPEQVAVGISAAQVLPALLGAVLGVPGGAALFRMLSSAGSVRPPGWWLLVTVLGAVAAVAALTLIPSRFGASSPVAEILQSETA